MLRLLSWQSLGRVCWTQLKIVHNISLQCSPIWTFLLDMQVICWIWGWQLRPWNCTVQFCFNSKNNSCGFPPVIIQSFGKFHFSRCLYTDTEYQIIDQNYERILIDQCTSVLAGRFWKTIKHLRSFVILWCLKHHSSKIIMKVSSGLTN